MKTLYRIVRKEFGGFFSSPVAFLFIAAFLAVILFIFFWVDTFFANNIAEYIVRLPVVVNNHAALGRRAAGRHHGISSDFRG